MPMLPNQRWELFAQELASGKSAKDAYTQAGYAPNRSDAASRLSANVSIQARVAEILGRRANGVMITRQWVLEKLVENVQRAMQNNAVTNEDGEEIEYRYEGSVANRGLELLGRELGMFVEQKNIRIGSLAELTPDQLNAFLDELGAGEEDEAPRGTSH